MNDTFKIFIGILVGIPIGMAFLRVVELLTH